MSVDSATLVFLLSVALILATPGPTNTLLAVAGLGLGWRRALPLLLAELAGYLISISVWGLLLAPLQAQHPWVATVVRVTSAGYLAYTAVKVWRDARLLHSGQQRTITSRMLLAATLLNPKGLLFALVVFPAQAFQALQAYAVSMVSFSCLLVPIGALWIGVGHALGQRRWRLVSPRKVQRLGSVAIAMFSVFIAWAALG